MSGKQFETSGVSYEVEVHIDAPRERVWKALFDEIDTWWLPDFHMVGADSTLTFEARAGGHLIEERPGGASLLWATVKMIDPAQFVVHLFGHLAPEWGGPNTSSMKWEVVERDGGSTMRLTDARFGHMDEHIGRMESGWQWLLTDGLKKHCES